MNIEKLAEAAGLQLTNGSYWKNVNGNDAQLTKFAELVAANPPAILFDGFAVLQALDDKAKTRTSAENVSDVLDAVVRLMRSNVKLTGLAPEKGD